MKQPTGPKPPDEVPTIEEQAPDFDGTQTIHLGEEYRAWLVAAHEQSSGNIDHDERGHARWKWNTQERPIALSDKTFNLLKALDDKALAVRESPDTPTGSPPAKKGTGYDPYDAARSRKPKPG
jgi:hypothetical protein